MATLSPPPSSSSSKETESSLGGDDASSPETKQQSSPASIDTEEKSHPFSPSVDSHQSSQEDNKNDSNIWKGDIWSQDDVRSKITLMIANPK
ncbi:MAG: hypothetical protein ACI8RD_012913 [Bacillariaceae sp.]|jgi:hypothetical protein